LNGGVLALVASVLLFSAVAAQGATFTPILPLDPPQIIASSERLPGTGICDAPRIIDGDLKVTVNESPALRSVVA
jgi:hypothetical protein